MGDLYEEWEIVDIAPNYMVSDHGKVQNMTTGKILKESLINGYPMVNLIKEGRCLKRGVHQLVATAFVEGKRSGLIVNHIDSDRSNYGPENLEWVTYAENARHAAEVGGNRKTRIWKGDMPDNVVRELRLRQRGIE